MNRTVAVGGVTFLGIAVLVLALWRVETKPTPEGTASETPPAESAEPEPPILPPPWPELSKAQHEEAERLGVPVRFENEHGMRFVLIPGGSFLLGSPDIEVGRHGTEGPQTEVTVAPFYLATTETTQLAWKSVRGASPPGMLGDWLPQTNVTWYDCQRLVEQMNETVPGGGYRLPSEAEWEYACRAGTTTPYWAGASEEDLARVAWCGAPGLHAVGQKPANPFGLYDVHGNAAEWCEDTWCYSLERVPTDGRARVWRSVGPSSPYRDRMVRGGGGSADASELRSASRWSSNPGQGDPSWGLRLVRAVDPAAVEPPRPRPHGPLLRMDNFDRAPPQADVGFDESVRTYEQVEGKGRLVCHSPGIVPLAYGRPVLQDFFAEFEFTAAAPGEQCMYGLAFGWNEDVVYYAVKFWPGLGMADFGCWHYGEWVDLRSIPVPAGLLQARGTNHVRVENVGQQVRVFLNRTFLWQHTHRGRTKEGFVALIASTDRGDASPVLFDDLRIYDAAGPESRDTPAWAEVSPAQIAEAELYGVPVAFEIPRGMRFVLVPSGTFTMGSPTDEGGRASDERLHEVVLTQPYYVQVTEMTNEQFRRLLPSGRSGSYEGLSLNGRRQPVARVSWREAAAFAAWLGGPRSPSLAPRGRRTYRLPTEAEWEYACRAGTRTRYSFGDGDGDLARYANSADVNALDHSRLRSDLDDGHVVSSPVGTYRPNAWGLYDMHGNVWEWCRDWYGAYPEGRAVDPTGPEGDELRVARGGGWDAVARHLRSATRRPADPEEGTPSGGFRLVSPLPRFGK